MQYKVELEKYQSSFINEDLKLIILHYKIKLILNYRFY